MLGKGHGKKLTVDIERHCLLPRQKKRSASLSFEAYDEQDVRKFSKSNIIICIYSFTFLSFIEPINNNLEFSRGKSGKKKMFINVY